MAAMAQRLAANEAEAIEATVSTMVRDGIMAGQISPALKDWAIATCRTDPAGFGEFLRVAPQIVKPAPFSSPRPPIKINDSGLSDNQIALCRNFNLPTSAFARNLQDSYHAYYPAIADRCFYRL